MKLKLDLHPIFSDSKKIEQGLVDIIAEAVDKRASEVEIIPGKGSGALKKTVLRFLERPEVKSLYHRVEKDDENFGRIFVHFRFHPETASKSAPKKKIEYAGICFCCGAEVRMLANDELLSGESIQRSLECGSCGSPNLIVVIAGTNERVTVSTEPNYEAVT